MYQKSIKIGGGGREGEGGGGRGVGEKGGGAGGGGRRRGGRRRGGRKRRGIVRFVCVSEFTSLSKFGFLTASICRSSFARLAARRFAWELLSAT